MLQSTYHTVGILLGHFHEREIAHQVNASHIHFIPMHILIEHAYDFACKHSVYLTHIDKQAGVSLLGSMVAPAATSWLFCVLTCLLALCDELYFWRIGILLKESSKLTTEDTLDEVFLVEPFPSLLYLTHKGSYLLLVDLHPFDVIYHMIELLGTYLSRFG